LYDKTELLWNLITQNFSGRQNEKLHKLVESYYGSNPLKENLNFLIKSLEESYGTVILTTGFPILKLVAPETDGPLGVIVLSKVLTKLGFSIEIITDILTQPVIEKLIDVAKVDVAFIYVVSAPKNWNNRVIQEIMRNVHEIRLAISVETPSPNRVGVYHNISGFNITNIVGHFAPIFEFFKMKNIPTIGIGDGGNEIGFGVIRDLIIRNNAIPFAKKCRCPCGEGIVADVKTDSLLSASTSNLGAYALSALLSLKFKIDFPLTPELEEKMLIAAIDAGAVDGITGEKRLMVDGIKITKLKEIISQMIKIIKE